MKISAEKNIHLVTILHENKHDRGAKGHLGSYLVQKSETVYAISRSEDGLSTTVEGLYTRNAPFPELELRVDGQNIDLSVKEPQGPTGRNWLPGDLEAIAKRVVGKSFTAAKDFIANVESCKPSEAGKALSLMEAGNIIKFTVEKSPKILLNLGANDYTKETPF
jgi:hypothetical protein